MASPSGHYPASWGYLPLRLPWSGQVVGRRQAAVGRALSALRRRALRPAMHRWSLFHLHHAPTRGRGCRPCLWTPPRLKGEAPLENPPASRKAAPQLAPPKQVARPQSGPTKPAEVSETRKTESRLLMGLLNSWSTAGHVARPSPMQRQIPPR